MFCYSVVKSLLFYNIERFFPFICRIFTNIQDVLNEDVAEPHDKDLTQTAKEGLGSQQFHRKIPIQKNKLLEKKVARVCTVQAFGTGTRRPITLLVSNLL